MISLARFSIRRPRAALAGWLLVAVVLSLIGLGVDKSVSPSVTTVRGTESYRAQELAKQKFGPTQLVPILLEGPKAQLDKQGPALVRDLLKRPHTRVLSAWDAGTAASSLGLRPKPTVAMSFVSVDRSEKDAVRYDEPQIEKLVARDVSGSVKAYVSGVPSIDKALNDEVISTLKTAAVIAFGVLFLLLLIGLRAPLAAGLVTIVAAATTMASFGILALLGKVMTVDAIALATGAIAGLSRGAVFSLVMLDRFHHDEDADHERTAQSLLSDAVGTTGRALLYAGTVMLVAMLLTDTFGPTDVLLTLGIGAFLCTALATGAAVVVVPAALVLFGPSINHWRLPAPAFLSRAWDRMVGVGGSIVRHPAPIAVLASVAMLALAVPALAIKSGPQDQKQLPPNNKARIAFNEIARVMGPGWPAPYDLIVVNPKGPLTGRTTLAQLRSFEQKIAKDGAVSSVVGPGGNFNSSAQQLKQFGPTLVKSAKISNQSKKDLLTLIAGLGQAGAGSAQLQSGLAQAASGAAQANSGSGQLYTGSGQLATGLAQAKTGSVQLADGLNQALGGAQQAKTGSAQLLTGSTQLLQGINLARGQAAPSIPALNTLASQTSKVSGDVDAALAALRSMTTGKNDAQYQGALGSLESASSGASGAKGLASTIAYQAPGLVAGLNLLHDGAAQLQDGLKQLSSGNAQLADGISQLAAGGGQLKTGLPQLQSGAQQIQAGLGQLVSGTGQLASGLASGVSPAGQLTAGLGQMQAAVIKARGQIPSTKDLEALQKQSPGIFNSGYFVLAAVEGATPADRNAATFSINLLQGGNAGQILVFGRYPVSDPRAQQLGDRLRTMASGVARSNHLDVAVGGPAGSLFDVTHTAKTKLPWVLFMVPFGVALLLALMLRSILIPTVAVLSAALTAATSFGVMQLLFGGSNPPLGGPGTFDPVTVTEVFATIFGATLVYLVVLLTRTRDYYVINGDARQSLIGAMGATKAATTGMATITLGVVIPFAFVELQPVRRIAVAAALAVAFVAFVIIPVILPAWISLLGRVGWWPTHAPRSIEPEAPARAPKHKVPRPHLPHRRPRPAHQ